MQSDGSKEEMSSASSTEMQLCSQSLFPSSVVKIFCRLSCNTFEELKLLFSVLNKDFHVLHLCFHSNVTTLNSGGTNILKLILSGPVKVAYQCRPSLSDGSREEMSSTSSTELQLCSQQREMDQHQRDQDLVHNYQSIEFYFIGNPVNSKTICVKSMLWYSLMTNNPWVAVEFTKCIFLPWQADNCSSLDFSRTSNQKLFHTQKAFLWIKESFEEQTKHSGKIELFEKIMNLSDKELQNYAMYDGRHIRLLLKHKENRRKKSQHAFAVVLMKDGRRWTSDKFVPLHRDKKNKNTLHSEEILIGQIEKFMQNNGTKVLCILIYTYNSPCLKRKKHTKPCMFLILDKALQWDNQYGVFTVVAFTEFWGLKGPNFFAALTYSDISNLFYSYIEKCNKIPFKLNAKEFRKNLRNRGIYRTLSRVEGKDKNKLREDISSAIDQLMKLAGSLSGLTDELLDRGIKMIASFMFPPQVQDIIHKILTDEWKELVINSSMSPVRQKMTVDFNTAVVKLFVKLLESTLGNSSPLKLYQLRIEDTLN